MGEKLHCSILISQRPTTEEQLEHIGIRGKEFLLKTSVLENRNYFVEVQGFTREIYNMPPMSVIQGPKLSGTLYILLTLDTCRLNQIMKDKTLFTKLTGQELKNPFNVKHVVISYVDNTPHVISENST